MTEVFQADKHSFPHQAGDQQKCFIAHSYEAEWHDTLEEVCNDLLPEYGLQPWYAEHNYDPTTTLRNKVVTMIDVARYGIYDLSYWRPNEHSSWVMPCNVLIELGIAIALNRPTILLRHTESRIAKIELPESIKSVTQISEFTGGDYSLEKALREHLSQLANLPLDQDWRHHRCLFGGIDCSYIHINPHMTMIGDDKLHCHIADGPDPDQIDFRRTVEKVLAHFNNISFGYLDKAVVPSGYTFLLCAHCQLIRSTPFAIYRITPYTLPDIYIAIGISIGLEYRSGYKIPRFMITKDMQHVPSLLSGYEFVLMKNLYSLKTRLPQFVQHIIMKIDEPAYWRPHELPFETRVLTGIVGTDDIAIKHMPQEGEQERKAVSIFVCYARKDEDLRQELERHLAILQRQGVIDVWHDMMINPGEAWEQEINTHITGAQVILILVSPDLMASEYIFGVEMKKVMERSRNGEAVVIPIILRPTDWRQAPFGNLQSLPRDGRAVTASNSRERVFAQIVEEIRRAVEERLRAE
jgi:TIR domain